MRRGGGPGNLPAALPVVERPRVPQPAAAGGHPAGRRREALPPGPVHLAGERRGGRGDTGGDGQRFTNRVETANWGIDGQEWR